MCTTQAACATHIPLRNPQPGNYTVNSSAASCCVVCAIAHCKMSQLSCPPFHSCRQCIPSLSPNTLQHIATGACLRHKPPTPPATTPGPTTIHTKCHTASMHRQQHNRLSSAISQETTATGCCWQPAWDPTPIAMVLTHRHWQLSEGAFTAAVLWFKRQASHFVRTHLQLISRPLHQQLLPRASSL